GHRVADSVGLERAARTLRRIRARPGRASGVSAKRRENSSSDMLSNVAGSRRLGSWRAANSGTDVGVANLSFQGQASLQTSQPNAQPSDFVISAPGRSPLYSIV